MNTIDLILEGTITNLTPLSIVPPNSPEIAVGDGKAAEVAVMPILRDGATSPVNLPIIPATTIRGFLRRAAARVCFAISEEKPDLLPYQYSTLGGIKGSEKETTFNIEHRNARRARNPVVALFGAAQPWDGSHAMVANAIPQFEVKSERRTGIRADDFIRDASIAEQVSKSAIPEYLQKTSATKDTSGKKQDLKKLRADFAKARRARDGDEVTRLGEELRQAEMAVETAKQESGTSIQLPLAHSFVPPGVVFDQSIRLMGVYPHEVGLFLAALSEFFEFKSYIGGKSAHDYGLVEASWQVRSRPTRGKWSDLGEIHAEPFKELLLPAAMASFADEWQKYLAGGTMNVHVTGFEAA